jgi:O-antigen/teichoic acid export membrane protein
MARSIIRRLANLTEVLYFVSSIGTRVLVFGAQLVLAHTLAASDFGQLSLLITIGLLIVSFASAWLSTSAYRFAAGTADSEQRRLETELLALFPWSFAIFAVGLAGFAAVSAYPAIVIIGGIALGLLTALSDLGNAFQNAKEQPHAYLAVSLLRSGAVFGLAVLCAVTGAGLLGAAGAYLLGTCAIFLAPGLRAIIGEIRFKRPDPAVLAKILHYGVPAGLGFNVYVLFQAVSRFLIAGALGTAEAGRYALASDVFYAPTALILGSFGLSYMPAMHGGWAREGLSGARPWMQRYLSSQVLFAAPVLIVAWELGDLLWNLLSPNADRTGELHLAFAATLNGLLLSLMGCFIMLQQVMGRPWSGLWFTLAAVVMNLVACLALPDGSDLSDYALASSAALALATLIAGGITMAKARVGLTARMLALGAGLAIASIPLSYLVRFALEYLVRMLH